MCESVPSAQDYQQCINLRLEGCTAFRGKIGPEKSRTGTQETSIISEMLSCISDLLPSLYIKSRFKIYFLIEVDMFIILIFIIQTINVLGFVCNNVVFGLLCYLPRPANCTALY